MEIRKVCLVGVLVPGACAARGRGRPTAPAVPPRVGSARGPPGSLHRHPATTQAHLPQHCIPSAPATLAPRWQGIVSPNKPEFSLVSVARRSGAAAVLVTMVSPSLYAAGRLHHHPANQHTARDPQSIVPRRPTSSRQLPTTHTPLAIRTHPSIPRDLWGKCYINQHKPFQTYYWTNFHYVLEHTVVKWKWPILSRGFNKLGIMGSLKWVPIYNVLE